MLQLHTPSKFYVSQGEAMCPLCSKGFSIQDGVVFEGYVNKVREEPHWGYRLICSTSCLLSHVAVVGMA